MQGIRVLQSLCCISSRFRIAWLVRLDRGRGAWGTFACCPLFFVVYPRSTRVVSSCTQRRPEWG